MLLLNQGMMQFFKHPTHRNDLGNMTTVATYFMTGPELTPAEIQNAINVSSTIPFNAGTLIGALRGSRTDLASIIAVPQKSNGGLPNSSVLRWSESAQTVQITTAGTLGQIIIIYYGVNFSAGRKGYSFSVGLPGSGADIELEKVDYVVGERIKLNDIVINIENLLGEA